MNRQTTKIASLLKVWIFLSCVGGLWACQTDGVEPRLKAMRDEFVFSNMEIGEEAIDWDVFIATKDGLEFLRIELIDPSGVFEIARSFSSVVSFPLSKGHLVKVGILYRHRMENPKDGTARIHYRILGDATPRFVDLPLRYRQGGGTYTPPPPQKDCDIVLTPSDGITFSFPPKDPLKQPIHLENRGKGICTFLGASLREQDTAFKLEDLGFPKRLGAGKKWSFWVHYDPERAGSEETAFVLAIEAPQEERHTLPIRVKSDPLHRVTPCRWHLYEDRFDMGAVSPSEKGTKTLSLYNVGREPCDVYSLRGEIVDQAGQPSPVFSLGAFQNESGLVRAGRSLPISLHFSPTKQGEESQGRLILRGEGGQQLERPVQGFGDQTCLRIPHELVTRHREQTCQDEDIPFVLEHTGASHCPPMLTLHKIAVEEGKGAFVVRSGPQLPLTLQAGQRASFLLRNQALDARVRDGRLVISHEQRGILRDATILLREVKEEGRVRKEVFTQEGLPKRDVLLVIHPSPFVKQRNENMRENWASYSKYLESNYFDLQVGVISSDITGDSLPAGCLHRGEGASSSIIKSNRFNPPSDEERFEKDFLSNTDLPQSSALNQSMEAVKMALSPEALSSTGCNAGFLRPDAELHLIFVGDQDDASPMPIHYYASFLKSLKGFRFLDRLRAFAIVGENGRRTSEGYLSSSPRYIRISQELGGFSDSLRTPNWASALSYLTQLVYRHPSRFRLEGKPHPSTIRVFVGGKELERKHWVYSPDTNAIQFGESAVPVAYSTFEIHYEEECEIRP